MIGIVPEAVETTQRVKAEAALRQSMKMEAIGQLTGGLAHDFNNLLTAVVGNLDLIRQAQRRGKRAQMGRQRFQGRRARIEAHLAAFGVLANAKARYRPRRSERPDLRHEGIARSVSRRHALRSSSICAPDLPPARADANQLELAILNLSLNARDAMPDGGTLTITTALSHNDTNP